jgi:type III restriction enzyme
MRRYLPDFIVLVDDGHGADDLLHLIVEIKGYRREDAKEKKATMEAYWVPGVNNDGQYGRWAFAEFTDAYQIQADFEERVGAEFERMISLVAIESSIPDFTDLEQADAYLGAQLGNDPKWSRLNSAITARMRATPDHAFYLADIESVSESAHCSEDETLVVLALLSRESARLLRMEFRSQQPSGDEVSAEEFARKLTGWWRTKSVSDKAWKEWASTVSVRWIPVGPQER